MPSVGMRRSTRVFVPKSSVLKDPDEPRVLRSGKRLWSFSSTDAKPGRGGGGEDEWFPMLDSSSADGGGGASADDSSCKGNNGWRKKVLVPNRSSAIRRFSRRLALPEPEPEPEPEPQPKRKRRTPKPKAKPAESVLTDDREENKMVGTGYGRKKPRLYINRNEEPLPCSSSSSSSSSRSSGSSESAKGVSADRKFGSVYVRKQRMNRAHRSSSSNGVSGGTRVSEENSHGEVLAGKPSSQKGKGKRDGLLCVFSADSIDISVDRSCDNAHLFSDFMATVLKFLRRGSSRVRLSELAVFMCSEPIAQTFSQGGILISGFGSRSSIKENIVLPGNCNFLCAQESAPLFSLNFSAAPRTFISLHFRFLLRSQHLLDGLVRYLMCLPREDYRSSVYLQEHLDDGVGCKVMSSESTTTTANDVNSLIRSSRLGGRSTSTRLNVKSKSIRKRRSSLGSARVRRPSSLSFRNRHRRPGGASLVNLNKPGVNEVADEVLDMLESNRQKKPIRSGLCKSKIMEPNQRLDSVSCSANILIIELDKCRRVEGVEIMLSFIDSREWCLAVKEHDIIRHTIAAENKMWPCTTNRVTRFIVWTSRKGLKLEFFNRQDWYTFKDLYKECVNRNIYATTAREVPIPVVHEVHHHGDDNCVPFVRPDDYIQMLDDEVERAISKKTANYDIDSGDERWLEQLNSVLCVGDDGLDNHVTHDKFEDLIDVFEKASYSNQDDVLDENRAIKLCSNFRTDIVAAVYKYWVDKRKLKNKALLRVFQNAPAPPRRAPALLNNPVILRKRRSFKRQGGKPGRLRFFLPEFAEQQEQEARRRAEEAQDAVATAKELAILKRRRAEDLKALADLAVYKAVMAVKFAEAVKSGVSVEPYVDFIND